MRFAATFFVLSILSAVPLCAFASEMDDNVPDANALAVLQAKADQAQPKDQCFLYAELVSQMTDLAGRQYGSGDTGKASATLSLVQRYAEKIRAGIAMDSKKLKNAELLMQHTSFRLKDLLSSASYEDREALRATLKQLDQVQSQLMMQVFRK
ncbi:MAG TPA: hypothetical protein VGM27_28420 [Acidobacteriaceae bacterium]